MAGGAMGYDGAVPSKKQNHCDIEKRRRDKMNHFITELASVLTAFNSNHHQSKLDKLTVLRMAVQHVKSLRSSLCSFSSFHLRPSFLSSGNLLKNLILQMASQEAQDNLFMVVTCDRGKVLFVSKSSKDILNQNQNELVGESLFDILHKDDVSKVKEQISYFNLMPKEMLVDSRTLQPIKSNQRESFFQLQNQTSNSTLQPGSRRSFFCRMKSGKIWPPSEDQTAASSSQFKTSSTTNSSRKSEELMRDSTEITRPDDGTSAAGNKQDQQVKSHARRGQKQSSICRPCKSLASTSDCRSSTGSGASSGSQSRSDSGVSSLQTEASPSTALMSAKNLTRIGTAKNSRDKSSADVGCSMVGVVNKMNRHKTPKTTHNSPYGRSLGAGLTSSTNGAASARQSRAISDIKVDKNVTNSYGNQDNDRGHTSRGGSSDIDSQESSISGDSGITSQDTAVESDIIKTNTIATAPATVPSTTNESRSSSINNNTNNDNNDDGLDLRSSTATNESPLSSTSSRPSTSSPRLSVASLVNNKCEGVDVDDSKSEKADAPPTTTGKIKRRHHQKADTPLSCTSSSRTGNSISANGNVHRKPYARKQWRYIVMHCTGYLKSITLRNDEFDDDDFDGRTSTVANSDSDDEKDEDQHEKQGRIDDNFRTVNCLVAVCRRSVIDRDLKPNRPLTFTCRYSMEGKFTFVDQRTTVALGYTPQQLIGTSHYAYCHKDSVNTFKECHRQCILKSETVSSDIYQFKRANGQYLWLQTSLKSFRNPWTKIIDYIVANHTTAEGSDPRYNEGCVPTKFNQDMTGADSQSSSPASSSSVDCKKSASPSSSSIESSYSMGSYASGASIQALLNQIDRVKSGGVQHSLEFSKKEMEQHHAAESSAGSSARKSNDDSGNFSDLQSCSSISSQNSSNSLAGAYATAAGNSPEAVSSVVANHDATSPNATPNQVSIGQQQHVQPSLQVDVEKSDHVCSNNAFALQVEHQHKSGSAFKQALRPNLCRQPPANYQQPVIYPAGGFPPESRLNYPQSREVFAVAAQHQQRAQANNGPGQYLSADERKTLGAPRMVSAARLNRLPPVNSTTAAKPLQRPYQSYLYRAPQLKPSMNDTDDSRTHQAPSSWSNSVATNNYSTELSHYQADLSKEGTDQQQQQVQASVCPNDMLICKIPTQQPATYVAQQHAQQQRRQRQAQQLVPISVLQQQAQMNDEFGAQMSVIEYGNEVMQPIGTFMTADARYAPDDINSHRQQRVQPSHQMHSINVRQQPETSQQQSVQRIATQHQTDNLSIPMVWNTSDGTYQTMDLMENIQTQQQQMTASHQGISNVRLVDMDTMENGETHQMNIMPHMVGGGCQQCAGSHKCSNNQQLVTSAGSCGGNGGLDLNGIHLSSLAMDDLDENELLECLATFDSNDQLYNLPTQNNLY